MAKTAHGLQPSHKQWYLLSFSAPDILQKMKPRYANRAIPHGMPFSVVNLKRIYSLFRNNRLFGHYFETNSLFIWKRPVEYFFDHPVSNTVWIAPWSLYGGGVSPENGVGKFALKGHPFIPRAWDIFGEKCARVCNANARGFSRNCIDTRRK